MSLFRHPFGRLAAPLLLLVAFQIKASAQTSAQADTLIQAFLTRRHVPAASVAIVRDGKIVHAKGYGMANIEAMRRASTDTVYQLASVTKQFTATAVMMLAEEGKLSLEDPLLKHLPDLPQAWSEVKIRHLLNHTSGIKSYTELPGFFEGSNMRKDYAQRELIGLVEKLPLDFSPETDWRYNNTGYYLLGMILEKVSGKPYGDLLNERIFKPLGMTKTRLNSMKAIIPDRAVGYVWAGGQTQNAEFVSPTQPFAAGALVSTVLDMAKWDAALYSEKLLKRSSLYQMWTPTVLKSRRVVDYGFGWAIGKVNGHRIVEHGGGINGFSTQINRYPEDKLTVIALTNQEGGAAGALAKELATLYLPALKTKKAEANPSADKNPEQTKILREVLLEATQGRVNTSLFSPEAATALAPRIREGKAMFEAFGAFKEMLFIERKEDNAITAVKYRVKFANQSLLATFILQKDGKIAGIGLSPDE